MQKTIDDFPETFILRFRVLPDALGPPPALRVRKFLKAALRAYGLKNEGFEADRPLPPPPPELDPTKTEPPF